MALPDGDRTDWPKNVLASGTAEAVIQGQNFLVDHPEAVGMEEATGHFRSQGQRLHRRFRVESALRLHRA